MAVLLADRELTAHVTTHPWARDAHGTPVPPNPATPREERGPYPGAATEQPDASWTLRADTRMWRLLPGDTLTDGTLSWVVTTALLRKVTDYPNADYIQITAALEPPRVP